MVSFGKGSLIDLGRYPVMMAVINLAAGEESAHIRYRRSKSSKERLFAYQSAGENLGKVDVDGTAGLSTWIPLSRRRMHGNSSDGADSRFHG